MVHSLPKRLGNPLKLLEARSCLGSATEQLDAQRRQADGLVKT
jgi:hypothetical protein